MTKREQRIYTAGQRAALSDHSRGMAIAAMRRVTQPTDNPAWVSGYRLMTARLALQGVR